MKEIGKWIGIEELANLGKKTKTYEVWNIVDNCSLGIISWKASWRKYAFFPYPDTCFEWDCLCDIATFCKEETREYKRSWRNVRAK